MTRYTLEVSWTEHGERHIFTLDASDLEHLEQRVADTFAPGVIVALVSAVPIRLGGMIRPFPTAA